MKALRRFTVRTHLPERLVALERLSINLRWSWDTPTQHLFAAIDPELWEQVGGDPVALLGVVSPKRLDELAVDDKFLARLDHLAAELDTYMTRPMWYQEMQKDGAAGSSCPAASRTSRWSSASPRCCRTTREASASWRAIT